MMYELTENKVEIVSGGLLDFVEVCLLPNPDPPIDFSHPPAIPVIVICPKV